MLKLTYSTPDDKYQTVTVLGDGRGLWDLWWRLTQAAPDNPSALAANVTITTLSGLKLDPSKGVKELIHNDHLRLSSLSD